MTWTAADTAEQDVLVHELARSYMEHGIECDACQRCDYTADWLKHKADCWKCTNGIRFTTEWYGDPCPRYLDHLAHTCIRCQPCPALHTAIDVVLEWRNHRELLSRAEELRLNQTLTDQTRRARNAAA